MASLACRICGWYSKISTPARSSRIAAGLSSRAPLVARQIPIWEGERVSGFVDLALERAFVYRPGQRRCGRGSSFSGNSSAPLQFLARTQVCIAPLQVAPAFRR